MRSKFIAGCTPTSTPLWQNISQVLAQLRPPPISQFIPPSNAFHPSLPLKDFSKLSTVWKIILSTIKTQIHPVWCHWAFYTVSLTIGHHHQIWPRWQLCLFWDMSEYGTYLIYHKPAWLLDKLWKMAPRPVVNRRQAAERPVRTGRIAKTKKEQSIKGDIGFVLLFLWNITCWYETVSSDQLEAAVNDQILEPVYGAPPAWSEVCHC